MKVNNLSVIFIIFILIIVILLTDSCDNLNNRTNNHVSNYEIIYETHYPDFTHIDTLISDRYSEFEVEYRNETYIIVGDKIWVLKKDRFPIIIKSVKKI